METHKILNSISFTLYKSRYYTDEYDSEDEFIDKINVLGYIIKEYDRYNYLTFFKYQEKIFCCVIQINKCHKNIQTKQIPINIYDKLINNFSSIDIETILEFKNSLHFIHNVVNKIYREKNSTYFNRITYYV